MKNPKFIQLVDGDKKFLISLLSVISIAPNGDRLEPARVLVDWGPETPLQARFQSFPSTSSYNYLASVLGA